MAGVLLGTVLVAAAFRCRIATVTPVVDSARWGYYDFADAAPLFGWRNLHLGWAHHVGSRSLPPSWCGNPLGATAPMAAPAGGHLADRAGVGGRVGPDRRLGSRFRLQIPQPRRIPHEVSRFGDVPGVLHDFGGASPTISPTPGTIHVSGHPPGAALVFVALDRIGLGAPPRPRWSAPWPVPAPWQPS
jgi:hypothetical protein